MKPSKPILDMTNAQAHQLDGALRGLERAGWPCRLVELPDKYVEATTAWAKALAERDEARRQLEAAAIARGHAETERNEALRQRDKLAEALRLIHEAAQTCDEHETTLLDRCNNLAVAALRGGTR